VQLRGRRSLERIAFARPATSPAMSSRVPPGAATSKANVPGGHASSTPAAMPRVTRDRCGRQGRSPRRASSAIPPVRQCGSGAACARWGNLRCRPVIPRFLGNVPLPARQRFGPFVSTLLTGD
jgi:hypothetical protein